MKIESKRVFVFSKSRISPVEKKFGSRTLRNNLYVKLYEILYCNQ